MQSADRDANRRHCGVHGDIDYAALKMPAEVKKISGAKTPHSGRLNPEALKVVQNSRLGQTLGRIGCSTSSK